MSDVLIKSLVHINSYVNLELNIKYCIQIPMSSGSLHLICESND